MPSRFAGLVLLLFAISACPQATQAFDAANLDGAFAADPSRAPISKTSYAGNSADDPALVGLRSFAQSLAAPARSTQQVEDDGPYDALRAYVRSLSDRSGPLLAEAMPKGSRADSRPAAAVKPVAAAAEATIVGSKVCLTCHATQAAAFSETLMGRIGRTHPGKFECENCHGPGSLHVKAGGGRGVGGIISFRPNDPSRSAEENNAICLGCHERGERTYWSGSTHETRGLQCTNCHTIMRKVSLKSNLKTAWELDTCFQCHKDRRAQLYRTSHMPLREGKMVCSDCHNPHGSFTEALLRENSINDNCYKCHAEKRGPFLFEHLPVRENCDNCHDPHGSVNEAMLKVSRPRLCGECHTFDHGPNIAGGPNVVFGFSRACNNCHTQVHGSNSPSGALLLR